MTAIAGHPRYRDDWLTPFLAAIQPDLRPGSVVIDIGGGRHPVIGRPDLPPGATYIGIDLSERELAAAPPEAYDRVIVADVSEHQPDLEGCADLVVSWQVLEHVARLDDAVSNIHSYLRTGGLLVAQLSGGRSVFALINRVIPHRVAKLVMKRLLRRDPASVFPAPYDRCTYSALSRTLESWSDVLIVPRYRGAQYFGFLPPLQTLYVRIEDLIARGNHRDLATHYLVVARR
ncbi:MAG TPA: methyltransferase domain-containing protein [Tepidiformaceae bacterium]